MGDSAACANGRAGVKCSAYMGIELNHIFRLDVPVSVLLAEKKMPVDEILSMSPGTVITFDKNYEAPLDLLANGKRIGAGVAVKVNENFGLQVKEMGRKEDTIRSLGS